MSSAAIASAIVVAVLATSMTFIDASALNQALPAIGDSLGATATQLIWVVGAYTAVLTVLLLPAGMMADRISRRGILAAGIVAFSAASLLCATAADANQLIAARAYNDGACWDAVRYRSISRRANATLRGRH